MNDTTTHAHTDDPVVRQLFRCAWSVIGLLARRRLHRDPSTVGSTTALPDGRTFTIFRDTSRDEPATGEPVTLAVLVPPEGRAGRRADPPVDLRARVHPQHAASPDRPN
jgi:hypothetical protein